MLQPVALDVGADPRKGHHFELSEVCGVLVYSLDQGPAVHLTFSHGVRLSVLVDTNTETSELSQSGTCTALITKPASIETSEAGTALNTKPANIETSEAGTALNGKPTNIETPEAGTALNTKPANIETSETCTALNTKPANIETSETCTALDTKPANIEQGLTDDVSAKPAASTNNDATKNELPLLLASEGQGTTRKSKDLRSENGSHRSMTMQKSHRKKRLSRNVSCNTKPVADRTKASKGKSSVEELSGVESKNTCEIVDEASQDGEVQTGDSDTVTKCQYCQQEFPTLRQFYDHRRTEPRSHQCGICGKVEPFEANLIVHMQQHGKVKVVADETGVAADSKTKTARKEKMKCTVCGLMLSSLDSLKIHTMLHTGESPYRCCVCGHKFCSLSSRQHHMDTHVTVDRFRCVQCNLRFSSRAELAKHQLTHQFKCSLCGQVFPNKTSRTCHFRVAHPSDILRCSQCPALFSCAESLERHKLYHARGHRQQCPTCGLVVLRLKEHMLLHSSPAQTHMFVCDQCPMRYLRKANLERHMRTHTGEKPYACSHCSKRFHSNGMLRKHLLTHTQERPFQCEVCGKRCALRSNLAVHMRVHSTNRAFACPMCGQTFNHKNSLQGHIRSKHSKPPPAPVAPQQDALGAFPAASVHSGQMCESPPRQPLQLSSVYSLQPMSNVVGAEHSEARPDYSQLMQLGYSPGPGDGLLDTAHMMVSQPALNLNYPNT